jgi:DNA-binding NtrC family response regulator
MGAMTDSEPPEVANPDLILEGVSTVFESLGRALVCMNDRFRVVHASDGLERLVGEGAAGSIVGRTAEEVFGSDLFGPAGSMRRALAAGERREGWGTTLQVGGYGPRLVSITGAPIAHSPSGACDPRVAYVVVLRPSEVDDDSGAAAPTIFSGMVARSASMLRIFRLVENLEESDATMLLGGESGTGKELLARAIHVHSPRRNGPFVAVNCGALPGELLESELFGHVRGAFTGAVRDRQGRFERAGSGTIFLDEIADVPLHLQVKLLRVLQEKVFERVGESTSRASDARVIAASHVDLRVAANEGRFRDDLFYRLRVVPIDIPPLRDRREDIEPLARHLLARVCRRHDRSLRLSPEAMRALLAYDWPGNVRELENALEYGVALSRGQTLHVASLPDEIVEAAASSGAASRFASPPPGPATAPPVPGERSNGEQERLVQALDAHRWRRDETARALGISRTTLWRKMREHGLVDS